MTATKIRLLPFLILLPTFLIAGKVGTPHFNQKNMHSHAAIAVFCLWQSELLAQISFDSSSLAPTKASELVYFVKSGTQSAEKEALTVSVSADSTDLRSTQNPLLGSWKVTAIHYEYTDTTYVVDSLDYGRFLFTEDKYVVLYNPLMNQRTSFQNLSQPSDAETIQAFRSIVFNSGSYELDDDVITNTPDIAKVPGFEDGKQYYQIGESGEQLTLTMFDETYPSGDKPAWYGKLKIKFFLRRE
ncbi:MAG: lipocalin-like domain-containing protein [Bacteroidota bacterium]